MNSIKKVQKHIDELIKQDNADSDKVKQFYSNALNIIKMNIQAFYNQYAKDEQLPLSVVSQSVNSWDLSQFKQAIDVLTANIDSNSDLEKRLAAAKAMAGIDRRSLIGGIIMSGIAVATYQAQQYGNRQLQKQYVDEYNYRNPEKPIANKDVPKDIVKQNEFNNRIWLHGDLASMRTRQTFNKATAKGLDKDSLHQLLKNSDDTTTQSNVDSAGNIGGSLGGSLLRTESINTNNQAKQDAYDEIGANYLTWVTQKDDKVCEDCQSLDGTVYKAGEAPVPQGDTHLGCRCSLELCDKDGNLL